MKLALKDRVLILKSVLPPYDSRRGIELKKSVERKIKLTTDESEVVVLTNKGYDQYELSFKESTSIDYKEEKEFVFTDEELKYLKEKVDFLDRDGRFSDYTLPTYCKVLDEPLQGPEIETTAEVDRTSVETTSENNAGTIVAEDEETYAH